MCTPQCRAVLGELWEFRQVGRPKTWTNAFRPCDSRTIPVLPRRRPCNFAQSRSNCDLGNGRSGRQFRISSAGAVSLLFISYASNDRAIVQTLKTEIERAGYSVWFDQNLVGAQQFRDVIDQRIDAAKAVVVIWTENSIGSKYVRYEAGRASSANKLICLRDPKLDVKRIPGPFAANDHLLKISDRDGLMAALARLGVTRTF
jgi:TIR domain-containing protein